MFPAPLSAICCVTPPLCYRILPPALFVNCKSKAYESSNLLLNPLPGGALRRCSLSKFNDLPALISHLVLNPLAGGALRRCSLSKFNDLPALISLGFASEEVEPVERALCLAPDAARNAERCARHVHTVACTPSKS